MLSASKLRELCSEHGMSVEELAGYVVRGGMDKASAIAAVKNWKKGLMKPMPRTEDIRHLAAGLSAEVNDLCEWRSTYRYAPQSAMKTRLVTELITGRAVQDALDVLKFTNKRAASMVSKVLKTAVADADEQEADVDNLYVREARVDDAGVRVGTKRWIPKDRGRAHRIRQRACHIHVTVTEA